MEIDISGLELYMAKSAVCLTVFYLLYWLLFRQITFFPLNRAYLLLGLIGSFVIPQSTLAILSTADNFNLPELMNTEPLAGLNYQSLKQEIIQQGQVDVTRFLELAYRCGLAFMIMKFVFSLTRMLWIVRRAKTISSNSLKVTTASSNAFTFFHLIILPEGETNPLILEHEKAHISQWHWIDLVLMELTVAAMWFNPFVYLYRYAVRLQLEYLADERVIKLGSSQHEYLRCLWSHISKIVFRRH